MTETHEKWVREQKRFNGIFEKGQKFDKERMMASAGIYGEEREFVNQAFEAGFDGTQAEALGTEIAQYIGRTRGVPLNSGTAAIHLALKLAGERIYGSASGISTPEGLGRGGSLYGKKVFCPDFATMESVAPVIYEGGEPIFIDCGDTDWSMDPEVLELAFQKYPDVRIVIMNHAYGFPGRVMEIRKICRRHGALLIEDSSESLGAEVWTGMSECDTEVRTDMGESGAECGRRGIPDAAAYGWAKTGSFGDYSVIDFGPGRIIAGGGGGMLLTDDRYSAEKALYWANGARADAPWNQQEELGYSYRMSDLTAAAARGQLQHLDEAIEKKKAVYERYFDKLEGDLASMIPISEGTRPNYWMSCMTCESGIGFMETRDDRHYTYTDQHGTAAPMEIYDALSAFHVVCRPLYKPMSMQPIFRNHELVTLDGCRRNYRYFKEDTFLVRCHRAKQYFESGICLPSGVGMTKKEQEKVMEIILACYSGSGFNRVMSLERKE